MRLTKKRAIEISIELWEWLAKTGAEDKAKWPGWKNYGFMRCDCPLCEYDFRHRRGSCFKICDYCPLERGYNGCYFTPYDNWEDEAVFGKASPTTLKKYAAEFLEVLKGLQ